MIEKVLYKPASLPTFLTHSLANEFKAKLLEFERSRFDDDAMMLREGIPSFQA